MRCRADEDSASFEIRDRGIGIPPEDQKRLFESFHRGKNVGNMATNLRRDTRELRIRELRIRELRIRE
ncbi:MAG: ATP-binding protein [Xenococcaceae cyanobacterium]